MQRHSCEFFSLLLSMSLFFLFHLLSSVVWSACGFLRQTHRNPKIFLLEWGKCSRKSKVKIEVRMCLESKLVRCYFLFISLGPPEHRRTLNWFVLWRHSCSRWQSAGEEGKGKICGTCFSSPSVLNPGTRRGRLEIICRGIPLSYVCWYL